MKKILYSLVLMSLLSPVRLEAGWLPTVMPNHWFGGDPYSSLVGTVAGLIASFSEPEMGATVNVIQEEADALESGSEQYVDAEMSGSATSQGFATTAYDYVNQNIFNGAQRSAWSEFDSKINSLSTVDDTEALIKKTFFIENKAEVTPEKEEEIRQTRTKYLQTIGAAYAELAQEVQTRLIEDLNSVKTTKFNGDGLIGAVTGVDQTWLAATRALMADIALQLQLLEVDAARFLQDQKIELIDKPEGLDQPNTTQS